MSADPSTSFSDIVDRLLGRLGPGIDTNTGSMARTLAESYAREMATFYAMLEHAHRSGYLDTAEGGALNNVVAVLGLTRARAGRLTGEVEFSRGSPAPEDIGIPAGRQVTGLAPPPDGKGRPAPLPLFETLEDAVLRRGDTRVTVRVQELQDDSEASRKAPPVINPGRLTVMPRPVLGVEAVTNPAPIRRTGEDETDESLRARARTALRDGETGTLESLAAAVRQQGVEKVTVREPPDALAGVVEVLVGDPDFGEDAQAVARVEQAIRVSKAAGIQVRLEYARTVYFELDFQVEPESAELDEATFDRVRRELQQALVRFFQALPVGEPVSRRKLEAVLFAHPAVRQISPLGVTTWLRRLDADRRPVLEREGVSRWDTFSQAWLLEPRDTATLDLERRPPRITRLRPPTYRVNLVVSRPRADTRTPEQVRQALRAALVLLTAQVAALAQSGQTPRTEKQLWSELQATLRSQAGVEALISATFIGDDGFARTLNETSEAKFPLVQDARLVLGEAELVFSA